MEVTLRKNALYTLNLYVFNHFLGLMRPVCWAELYIKLKFNQDVFR